MVRVTLLVVDDNELDRYVVKRSVALSDLQCDVVEFSSGDEFVGDLASSDSRVGKIASEGDSRALVLLDINMPGMSGFDVVDAIRASISDGRLPSDLFVIVIYSSSDHEDDRLQASSDDLIRDYVEVRRLEPAGESR